LISKEKHVGIDIEKMQSKIEHIAHKFLKSKEIEKIDYKQRIYHLYLHWCAKEALYKMCDKKNMSLKEAITIDPFIPGITETIHGTVHYQDINERFELKYFSIDNYSLVWSCK
jgi:phosphopantetheine--protein transferase-like protein